MASDFVTVVKAIKEWAEAPIKTMLIVCCISGAAIFLPITWRVWMGVGPFIDSHIAWGWAIFLFSALYLVFTLTESKVIPPFSAKMAEIQMDKKLQRLAPDECQILQEFLRRGQTCIYFREPETRKDNSALMHLVTKGILNPPCGDLYGDSYSLTSLANISMRKPHVNAAIRDGKF